MDLDSSVSETYGEQEGSAYNGHFRCTCYHPLFCFNQFGDLERALLLNGNVHSADDWRSVLEPVMVRYRGLGLQRFFRADAAFARPEAYEFLEAEGYLYAIRLPGKRSSSSLRKSDSPRSGGTAKGLGVSGIDLKKLPNKVASWKLLTAVVGRESSGKSRIIPERCGKGREKKCRYVSSASMRSCYRKPLVVDSIGEPVTMWEKP